MPQMCSSAIVGNSNQSWRVVEQVKKVFKKLTSPFTQHQSDVPRAYSARKTNKMLGELRNNVGKLVLSVNENKKKRVTNSVAVEISLNHSLPKLRSLMSKTSK